MSRSICDRSDEYTAARMNRAQPRATTSRRDFLAAATLGRVVTVAGGALSAGCHKRRTTAGTISNAKQTAEVLPRYRPVRFLSPDIPGEGSIPDGYLKYPTTLVRAIEHKPGSSGRPIK